jgi:hypothetical protein
LKESKNRTNRAALTDALISRQPRVEVNSSSKLFNDIYHYLIDYRIWGTADIVFT